MQKILSATILFFLSFLCLVLGLSLFVLQSPQHKIDVYTQTAHQLIEKADDSALIKSASLYLLEEAGAILRQATVFNPYDIQHETALDMIEERKDNLMRDTNTAFLPHKELIP